MGFSVLKGMHRRALGITPDDQVAARSGFVAGGDDRPSIPFPAPDTVALFDDFLGDVIADQWAFVHGDTGTGDTVGTGITSATNGVYRLQSQVTPKNVSTENLALTGGVIKQWKGNQGKGGRPGYLHMAARVKLESVSTTAKRQHVFIGFGDSGGAEFPLYDTGGGIISNASNLLGFAFSPDGSTLTAGKWSIVGTKDNADQSDSSGVTPTANTYDELEITLTQSPDDSGGVAHFSINGVSVGQIVEPVSMTTALTPWLGFWPQDTGARFMDIDYVAIAGARDTGM